MLICARCSQEKYGAHETEAPHKNVLAAARCDGYLPAWPCGNCGQDLELHDVEAPHAAPDFDCEGAVPQEGPEGGGGFGGGGASGGW